MDDDNDYMDVDGIMDFAMTASLDSDNERLIKQSLGVRNCAASLIAINTIGRA